MHTCVVLHRRDYPTVPTMQRTGREWTQRESPFQPGRTRPREGAEVNRTATALGDVAWAAAGVLGPRDVLPVGPQLPISLCCAVMTQSPHTLLQRVSRRGPPERLRPTKSPDRQRSGLATTDEWRPGRRRATRLPTVERAIHGACKSSVWVRVNTPSKKGWHTGGVQLHLYAASYRRCLLRGFGSLLLVGASGAQVTKPSGEVIVENFVMERLSEAVCFHDRSRRSREMQNGRSQPPCVRIADYRVVRALVGITAPP